MTEKELREELVKTIVDLSGDEFEDKEDYLILAKETVAELTVRVCNIAYALQSEPNTP